MVYTVLHILYNREYLVYGIESRALAAQDNYHGIYYMVHRILAGPG